ncbi:MAG TPA: 3-phenylpropionate/cinnamic acid dioxygenase subunit beta [Streptosporangiaceae bacterium]|nr:3-phenylpropionate/cinnamic acid dioxygenase subunit beta [Streptosporangiaceae bacterium]
MNTTANEAGIDLRAVVDQGRPLPYSDPAHQAAAQFLTNEAHLLDGREFATWLALLAPDIQYRVPVRVTAVGSSKTDDLLDMEHFAENFYSLRKRVERLSTEHAWAEDPPSRTRRFVTNVRTFATGTDGDVVVESYLLLYRSRGDQLSNSILSGVRMDLLRAVTSEECKLARRLVILDDSVLNTQNLAVFF